MNKLQKRITTALAAGALLTQMAAPAFAGTTSLVITGNGSDSENEVEIEQKTSTSVVQENYTSVSNDIKVEADTGSNKAEDNTGGDVEIDTGDADVKVAVSNDVNSNMADVNSCDCEQDAYVEISGNGTGSENEAELELESETGIWQKNVAKIYNDVDVEAETGDNKAEDNTGGDVKVYTGDADAKVMISNLANSNSARISPSEGDGGSVDLIISGNGSDSENEIELELERAAVIDQENKTMISNDVDVEAETGDNEAEDNTGGEVMIDTGDAWIKAIVDNAAGFNYADLGCDCLFEDVWAKIAGNGTDSENEIEAELESETEVYQANSCGYRHYHKPCFDNDLDLEAETGDNEVEDNTAEAGGDPSVTTGDTDVEVGVSNTGGSNTFGDFDFEWPWGDADPAGFGFELQLTLDLGDLLALLS